MHGRRHISGECKVQGCKRAKRAKRKDLRRARRRAVVNSRCGHIGDEQGTGMQMAEKK